MKRHELIKHLHRQKCKFLEEGTKHTQYWNPGNRRTSSIPRHVEISNNLARKICKDLGVPFR